MSVQSFREQERYLFSFIIAIIIHAVIFIAASFFLMFSKDSFPEYSGPLTIEIADVKADESVTKDTTTAAITGKEEPVPDREMQDKSSAFTSDTSDKNKSTVQEQDKTSAVGDDDKAPFPDENYTTGKNKNSTTGSKESDTVADSNKKTEPTPGPAIQTTAPSTVTPVPAATAEPYVPGLEEGNLAELDKLLEQGGSSAGTDTSSKDSTDKTSKSGNKESSLSSDKQPEFVWEDNRNRKPVVMTEPDIPAWVAEQRLKLVVIVSFVLTPDGILSSLRVEQSSGYSLVDARVTDALRKWKFESASGSKNVRGQITYYINVK